MRLAGIADGMMSVQLDTYELARLAQACRVAATACSGTIDTHHLPELREGPEAPDAAWLYEAMASHLEAMAILLARQTGQCALSGPGALRWVRGLRSPVLVD